MNNKEDEINRLIETHVRKYLKENKKILFEMAIERGDYVSKSEGIIRPLMKHVLLISYCSLYDRENQYFRHWKDEVWAFCEPLTDFFIKKVSKGNQEQVKRKALQQSWVEESEIYSDRMICGKWNVISRKENIVFNLTIELKNKYIEIMNHLIDIISKSNDEDLGGYVDSI